MTWCNFGFPARMPKCVRRHARRIVVWGRFGSICGVTIRRGAVGESAGCGVVGIEFWCDATMDSPPPPPPASLDTGILSRQGEGASQKFEICLGGLERALVGS